MHMVFFSVAVVSVRSSAFIRYARAIGLPHFLMLRHLTHLCSVFAMEKTAVGSCFLPCASKSVLSLKPGSEAAFASRHVSHLWRCEPRAPEQEKEGQK
jgi:hypothetical protein